MAKTRTNIEIENQYVETIMDRFGVHTKTDAGLARVGDVIGIIVEGQ